MVLCPDKMPTSNFYCMNHFNCELHIGFGICRVGARFLTFDDAVVEMEPLPPKRFIMRDGDFFIHWRTILIFTNGHQCRRVLDVWIWENDADVSIAPVRRQRFVPRQEVG